MSNRQTHVHSLHIKQYPAGTKTDCATRECMYVMATSEPTAVVTTTTRMCDVVVCERCDDIGELLKLSFLAGLQGNYVFEGHLI